MLIRGGAVARVFLSHASEDRALAAELHEWLGLEGHEVFLAEDLQDGIAVGEEWQQRLHEQLRWADAVINHKFWTQGQKISRHRVTCSYSHASCREVGVPGPRERFIGIDADGHDSVPHPLKHKISDVATLRLST
jgi:hypothetical protein